MKIFAYFLGLFDTPDTTWPVGATDAADWQ
jgi:hypothetical protein